MILSSLLINNNYLKSNNEINDYNRNFLNAQIEAIINGKSEMFLKPSKELLSLSNPYDVYLRRDSPINLDLYIDYSLYNGKLYSYFGLTPIIILMLPYKLITGKYLSNFTASSILFLIMLFAFAKLYKMLVNRYVSKVTFVNYILGFITVFFASSISYLVRGQVYDIVEICGILFIMISYILVLSIYNNSNRKLYIKIFLCSISMGLIVLSKPSYIIYYIFLFYLLFNLRKILEKKEFLMCIKIFIIPISCLAFIQMYFNYVRFDSIFSFGNRYQVTAMDPTNLYYLSPIKYIKGFIQYLFQLPKIDLNNFPFLFISSFGDINYEMNVATYDVNALGFFVVPVVWGVILYNKFNLHLEKELKNTIKIFSIMLLLLLLINIRNGVAEVYITDIKLFMYMLSIIIYFKIMEEKSDFKFQSIFYVICFISILITLPLNITFSQINYYMIDSKIKVYLKNIFEFWL